ncbi:MAG: ACT domain-containing protein [Bacillota bacterium]|jgi:ACT domain-containing protein
MKNNRIVITVVGKDKVGIIAGVANILAECNANIIDISQTIMQEFFTMIMMVDISNCTVDFGTLKELLQERGNQLEVKITAQHEDVFHFMHRI